MTETIQELINLSNEKVADFNSEKKKAEEEQKALLKAAMKKISDYLLEIRDAGFKGDIEYKDLNLYWLNKGESNTRTKFSFSDNGVCISEYAACSQLHEVFEHEEEIKEYRWNRNLTYMAKTMVNHWSEIKPKLEEKLQECLTERMSKSEKNMNSVKEMNEKLANFEI